MRNKKIMCLFMTGAMALSLLTGCGSKNSSTSKTTEKSTKESTTKESTTKEETTKESTKKETTTSKESEKTTTKSDSTANKDSASIDESEYLFGTLDLTYADYYYGELEDVSPEENPTTLKGEYDVESLVNAAGFEEEGMYDAVSSATTTKSKAFELTFTEDTDTGVDIIGPKSVNVAISKALYDDVQEAITNNTECKNNLVDFVKNLQDVSENVPVEYKVINSDGTISKTIGSTTKVTDADVSITTTSNWGNYQITIDGPEIDINTVQGGIIETEDGEKYGLQHLDNLWLQAGEIGFSVKEFIDPHDNTAGYKRFEDIEGKTITKVTYLIDNADDIEVDTSLYCKEQLASEYNAKGDESVTYNSDGTEINVTFNVPEDSDYDISDVIKSRASLEKDLYKLSDNTVTLNSDCKPGQYKLVFSDEKYADISVTCLVESGLSESDITFDDGKITVADNDKNLTVADYLAGITAIKINGEALSGQNLGTAVFDEEGGVNLDATIKSRDSETAVFPESGSYTISLEATGYPSLELTVSK